jgi:hypothetical protein
VAHGGGGNNLLPFISEEGRVNKGPCIVSQVCMQTCTLFATSPPPTRRAASTARLTRLLLTSDSASRVRSLPTD